MLEDAEAADRAAAAEGATMGGEVILASPCTVHFIRGPSSTGVEDGA